MFVTRDGTIIYDDFGEGPWKTLNAKLVARVEFKRQRRRAGPGSEAERD